MTEYRHTRTGLTYRILNHTILHPWEYKTRKEEARRRLNRSIIRKHIDDELPKLEDELNNGRKTFGKYGV